MNSLFPKNPFIQYLLIYNADVNDITVKRKPVKGLVARMQSILSNGQCLNYNDNSRCDRHGGSLKDA